MRLIVIEQESDLKALSARLLKKPAGRKAGAHEISQATLDQVKMLNPHVDFQRLEAGTVLLLPDSPELNDKESQPLAGDSFEDFVAHTSEGFKAVAQRMTISAKALDADRAAVNATLKIVKRQIDSDPLLQNQVEEANREFTDAQMQAKDAASQVETMQKEMDAELKALRKMLT